jgi:hypothetical protein
MKIITINLGPSSIEFHNSLVGKETIKVNGEIVSSRFSVAGMEHVFTVEEGGEDVVYKLKTGLGFLGLSINLFRDDAAIILGQKTNGWLKITLLIILIIFLGIWVGDFISGLVKN